MDKGRDWKSIVAIVAGAFVALSIPAVIVTALAFSRSPGAVGDGGQGGQQVQEHRRDDNPIGLVPDVGVPNGMGGQGIAAPTTSDDDGELHDGWDPSVSYTVREERYEQHESGASEAYDLNLSIDVDAAYPQLENAGPHTDEINAALRDAALSFANQYVTDPSAEVVQIVRDIASESAILSSEDVDAVLSSSVTWAITYNTDDFVSVSFSDQYYVGSYAGGYIQLRCVNANLATGELYDFDDVLSMDEEMARQFVDALVANTGEDANFDGMLTDDESFSVAVIGREEWMRALMGEGDYAHRMVPTFFVDEKGRVNLGVTYWLSSDRGIVRGWWDATLTDEQVDAARKPSSMWELLEKVPEDG